MKNLRQYLMVSVMLLLLGACSSRPPISDLQATYDAYPEYTVILEDMKTEGNFFQDYYHRYKVVYGEPTGIGDSLAYQSQVSDWVKVEKKQYQKLEPYLGMTLAAKTPDGEVSQNQHPPGYQYVGNPQYGQWRERSDGTSFWEFYGKYALLSTVFNSFRQPVYRSDWDGYRRASQRREPYFGNQKQYGTYGSQTQKTHKTFFERRQARETLRKQSFSEKVKNRTRRSNMSRSRSRSGGFGK